MGLPTTEQVGALITEADEIFRSFVAVCAFAVCASVKRQPCNWAN